MRFDHLGLFVKTIDLGREHLTNLFPIVDYSQIYNDDLLKVSVQFLYDKSGICYEIVAPFGDGNPVDPVLKKNRNILNHVAYRVRNLESAVAKFRQLGCIPLGEVKPALAFEGARIIFLLTPLRIIVELIEGDNE